MSYNEDTSRKYGWEPSWFGADEFGPELDQKIIEFQKELGITADGLVGPSTYRRIFAHREANIDDYEPAGENIVYNGNFFPIKWDKVILWDEAGGLKSNKGTYWDYSGREPRDVSMFVNHWDVCLSAKSCASVLNKRGISVHFCIDNDGTIYQTLDLQHAAWHAGSARTNRPSIGVEISNAYYPKYQEWYVKNGFGERPLIEDAWVHGNKLEPFLGFYPEQLKALKALWKAIHEATEIPYQTPLSQFGKTTTKYAQEVAYGTYSGFVSHYHVSKSKIDCAGLDLKKLLDETKYEITILDKIKND